MKRIAFMVVALLLPALALAAEGNLPYTFHGITTNLPSIQRGAKDFANYCAGCHTLKYLRYKRVSKDLHIPKSVVQKTLDFPGNKFRSTMTNAMPDAKAKQWFGKVPPDLSLEARYRGADWIYSYLMTFYLDPSRPTGVNNVVLKNSAMPFPLWKQQGWQVPVYTKNNDGQKVVDHLKLGHKGTLSPAQYEHMATDITNFLVYAGEPVKMERMSLGLKVMIYLVILTIILYFLKREFWKDVH